MIGFGTCLRADNKPLSLHIYSEKDENSHLFDGPKPKWCKLAKTEAISFKSGLTIHGYITFPLGRGENLHDISVHGGLGGYLGFDQEVNGWPTRGYLVLQVNFRGSSQFHVKIPNAGNKDGGKDMTIL